MRRPTVEDIETGRVSYAGGEPIWQERDYSLIEENERPKPEEVWPVLVNEAFHGPAGRAVKTIEPHSEADPVAILLQYLTAFGNAAGHTAYFPVEGDRHTTNLFVAMVGQSSKARKGTSFGRVKQIIKGADLTWYEDRTKGGLSSGEGLIHEVRDEVRKYDAEEGWKIVDPGVADKRLLVVEPELAGALSVMERHGNTLSPIIRRAWDGDKLTTLTKTSPLKATGAHISIIGHITRDELKARLTRTDIANGFANRFLFACVKRSKSLPFGGRLTEDDIDGMSHDMTGALAFASSAGMMTMSETAANIWRAVYERLSEGQDGLLGAVTGRAEAQCIRLAVIYALLDNSVIIKPEHGQHWRYGTTARHRPR